MTDQFRKDKTLLRTKVIKVTTKFPSGNMVSLYLCGLTKAHCINCKTTKLLLSHISVLLSAY